MTTKTVSLDFNNWFCPALFLLFLGLKLTGHIDWSWWWVTAPLWAPVAVIAVIAVGAFLIAGIITCLAALSERPKVGRRWW